MRRNCKEQLIDYFIKNLKKNYTPDTLKWALINQGYSRVAVERSLEEAQKEIAKQAPVFKEKPLIKYQLFDQNNNPIKFKKHWWKEFLNFFKK